MFKLISKNLNDNAMENRHKDKQPYSKYNIKTNDCQARRTSPKTGSDLRFSGLGNQILFNMWQNWKNSSFWMTKIRIKNIYGSLMYKDLVKNRVHTKNRNSVTKLSKQNVLNAFHIFKQYTCFYLIEIC